MARNKEKKVRAPKGAKGWAVWKTLLIVFFSVLIVAGGTVLGVYLAGGFDKAVVKPDDLVFEYDDKIYNNNQLEVTSDFSLKLYSNTSLVTEKQVELTFKNTGSILTYPDGTISDGVIRVPRMVEIGTEFPVKLEMRKLKLDDGRLVDWIKGGISRLSASSTANIQLDPKEIQIAVDVPVQSIKVEFYNLEGKQIDNIMVEEKFIAKNKFFPAESEYLYSDDSAKATVSEKRKKLSFFEGGNADDLSFVYNEGDPYFETHKISSPIVKGYTFIDARSQQLKVGEFEELYNGEQLYNSFITALNPKLGIGKCDDKTSIDIVPATISEFLVRTSNIELIAGLKNKITVNATDYSDKHLGASVLSSDGETKLESMLKYIGIRFTYENNGQVLDASEILNVKAGQIIEVDGKKYLMPNSNVINNNYAFWDVFAREEGQYNMEVVLFQKNAEDQFEIFKKDGASDYEKTNITLNIVENTEDSISWSESANKKVSIALKVVEGGSTFATYDLGSLSVVPDANIYKRKVFFVDLGNKEEDFELANTILGLGNYNKARSGFYTMTNGDVKYLYALDEDYLAVVGVGNLDVYFATVLVEQDVIVYDENGLYRFAQIVNSPIEFEITKALHTNSITGLEIQHNLEDTEDGKHYIEEGSLENFTLVFNVNLDSVSAIKDVLKNLTLTFKSASDNDITSYFNVSVPTLNETERTLSYQLQVNNSLGLNSDVHLSTVILSVDSLTWENSVAQQGLYFYTPRVQDVTQIDTSNISILNGTTINFSQNLDKTGTSQTVITDEDGNRIEGVSTLEDLISKISNIIITDQHGKTNTLSAWTFASNSNDIVIDGKRFIVNNVDGASAELWLAYGEVSTEETWKISLNLTSSGISHAMSDTSLVFGEKNLDARFDNPTSLSVTKYGLTTIDKVNLNELVQFYLDENNTYNMFSFKLQPSFVDGLGNELSALFGGNGMLTLTFKDGTLTSAITNSQDLINALKSKEVVSIKVNHDFGRQKTLEFDINIATGYPSVQFNLQIIPAKTMEGSLEENYYAQTGVDLSNIKIKNSGSNTTSSLKDFLNSKNNYYVVEQGNKYSLSVNEEGRVGKVENGNLVFDDFWDKEQTQYIVVFSLSGTNNTFAFAPELTFNIKRNIKVEKVENIKLDITASSFNKVLDYIRVTREQSSVIEIPSAKIEYEILEGNNVPFIIKNGDITRNKTIFFDYNEKVRHFSVKVKVDGTLIGTIQIEYTLENIFNALNIAEIFKLGENVKPSIQEVDGVEYLYVTPGEWDLIEKDFEGFDIRITTTVSSLISNNGNYINNYRDYSLVGENFIIENTFKETLLGLDNREKFVIANLYSGNTLIGVKILPLIISNNGFDFVHYTDYSQEKSTNNLQTALTIPEDLLDKGIYQTVDAGSEYIIAHGYDNFDNLENVMPENEFGFTYYDKDFQNKIDITISAYVDGNDKFTNSLINKIYKDGNVWKISLNHLSNQLDFAYVALQMNVRLDGANDSQSQNYYYLLKVSPSVQLGESARKGEGIYAYNSTEEYLKADSQGNYILNLNEKFGSNTLKPGHSRFDYFFKDEYGQFTTIGEGLKYTDYIKSVKTSSDEYYNENDWKGVFSYSFSEDKNSLSMNTKTTDTLTITIARKFSSEAKDTLQIIGGEITYKVILNASRDFVVRVSADAGTVENKDDGYHWSFDSYGERDYKLNLNLMQVVGGDTITSTEGLQVVVRQGEIEVPVLTENVETNTFDINTLAVQGYSYKDKVLTIRTHEYLDKDAILQAHMYTNYGYVGSVTIHVGASASVKLNENKTFEAGNEITLKNGLISEVTLLNEINNSYTISNIEVDDEHKGYFVVEDVVEGETEKTISIISSVKDFNATLTITLAFGENQTYTFSVKIVVNGSVKKVNSDELVGNVSSEDKSTENINYRNTVIAGNDLNFEITNFTRSNQSGVSSTWVWQSNNTNIIADGEFDGNNNRTIPTNINSVDREGAEVTLRFTITLKKLNSDFIQTFYVNYVVKLESAGTINVNYPKPNSSYSENAEYIETGSVFMSVQDFFFNNKAMFAEGNRVVCEERTQSDTAQTEETNQTIETKITLTRAENSLVYVDKEGNGVRTLLDEGNELQKSYVNLEFILSDREVNGYVTFTITYGGYSEEYNVVVAKNVYSLILNQDTNNTTGSGVEVTENFFVDDLANNSPYIFENDRIIKYRLKDKAPKGEYIAVFEKTINVNENAVKIETQTFELAITETSSKDFVKDYGNVLGTLKGVYLNSQYKSYIEGAINESALVDYNNDLFENGLQVTSRLVMTYNGTNVSYENFNSLIKFDDLSVTELSKYVAKIDNENLENKTTIDSFKFDYIDGNKNAEKTFGTVYNYTLALNVKADTYIHDGSYEHHVLYAQDEKSVVETMGLRKMSNGELLTSEDFSNNVYLQMQMLSSDSFNDEEGKLATAFRENIGNSQTNSEFFKLNISGENSKAYMAISPVREVIEGSTTESDVPSRKVYDYKIWGLGAPNAGVYNMAKLTYTVKVQNNTQSQEEPQANETTETEYSKTFYVIFKIMPAFDITVGISSVESTEKLENSDIDAISNIENPYEVFVNEQGQYSFTLTGEVLKVNYKYGTSKADRSKDFTYKATYNKDVSSVIYNNKINADAKKVFNGWTSDNEIKPNFVTKEGKDGITITANKIVFGSQDYRLEVSDDYGYTFFFYFRLISTENPPTIASGSDMILTEESKFDVGAVATSISVSEGEKVTVGEGVNTEEKTRLIFSPKETIIQESEKNVFNISGFNFYYFESDYWQVVEENPDEEIQANKQYFGNFNTNENKYEIFSDEQNKYTTDDTNEKYLTPPNYEAYTIARMKLYYNNIDIGDISMASKVNQNPEQTPTTRVDTVGESQTGDFENAYLAVKNPAFFGRLEGENEAGIKFNSADDRFVVPTIENSQVWSEGGSAKAILQITLKYTADKDSNDVEEYALNVPITLNRKIQISNEQENYVRDGEEFNLVSEKNSNSNTPSSGKISVKDAEITKIFNDTLEVTVPAYQTVEFNIGSVNKNGTINKLTHVGYTNNISSAKTYYLSISKQVGKVLTSTEDEIYIEVTKKSSVQITNTNYYGYAFSYNGSTFEITENDIYRFNLKEQQKNGDLYVDKLSIVSYGMMKEYGREPVPVTKYYIVGVTPSSQEMVAEGNTTILYYRHSTPYNVTWAVDACTEPNPTDLVSATQNNGKDTYSVFWSNLISKIEFYYRLSTGNEAFKSVDASWFDLVIDKTGSGFATIDADGKITTQSGFDISTQYITVIFRRKVSGLDGTFNTSDDDIEIDANKEPFLTYRFKLTTSGEQA